METYCNGSGVPPEVRAAVACSFLTPDALRVMGLARLVARPTTFAGLRRHMTGYFFGADQSARYLEEVNRAAQRTDETIEAFSIWLRDLVRLANQQSEYVSSAAEIARFICGLRDPLTRRLLQREQATDAARCSQGRAALHSDFTSYVQAARLAESAPTDGPTAMIAAVAATSDAPAQSV